MTAIEDLLGCGGWCPLTDKNQHNPTGGSANGTYFLRFKNINDCTDAGNF